jgi:hypothetical protein
MPRHLDPAELLTRVPGIYYEPRALWGSSLIVGVNDGENPDNVIRVRTATPFQKNAFLNGERVPYVLTHMLVQWCQPGGYLDYNTGRLASRVGVSVGRKGTARFGRNSPPLILDPVPRSEAYQQVSLTSSTSAAATGDKNLGGVLNALPTLNTCRWDFDHPCVAPADTQLEIMVGARLPTADDTTAASVRACVNLYAPSSAPANFPGNAFTAQELEVRQLTLSAATDRFAEQMYQLNSQLRVLSTDSFTPPTAVPFVGYTGGTEPIPFPPRSQLSGTATKRQKANFRAPAALGGFAVTIDERDLDEGKRLDVGPLSVTTPIRIRSRNGGSGAYWWRDYAPLSMVTPSMTPATVSKLRMPLTLAPGEELDVSLLLRGFGNINGIGSGVAPTRVTPSMCYISFCGFAAYEA